MPVVTRDEFVIHTSDIHLDVLRQPRLHITSFNGTLGGGLWSPRKSVVPAFVQLISKRENVYETHLNGVGTDGSWSDWMLGSIAGMGTLRNVVNALKNLSKGYHEGDRIIGVGYSRGAWAARYLALLISVIGIPKNGDEKLFHRIYKACHDDTIWEEGVATKLLKGYNCWNHVRINALCCFDTVGSLGLPLTGIAKPLSILRRWSKKHDIISDVAPNVDYAFHALALHERREPYSATLMNSESSSSHIYQVSFPGSHSNLGWIRDGESLVHGPLAWMVQQVHTFAHVEFSDHELAACFPSFRPEGAEEPTRDAIWYRGNIKCPKSGTLAIMGKKVCRPGRTNSTTRLTDMRVHIGARLRNYGILEGDTVDAVPGYTLQVPATGLHFWALRLRSSRWPWSPRTNSSDSRLSRPSSLDSSSSPHVPRLVARGASSPDPKAADRIDEAAVGALEARCLGLPLSVVTDLL